MSKSKGKCLARAMVAVCAFASVCCSQPTDDEPTSDGLSTPKQPDAARASILAARNTLEVMDEPCRAALAAPAQQDAGRAVDCLKTH